MKKFLFSLLSFLIIPFIVYGASFESKTGDAQPIVLYGKNGTTIVPLAVDSSGHVSSGAAAGATFKVCSSTAASTAGCQYTATGTSDDVPIQAAISALPAAGGKVYLSEGRFTLANEITLPSNTILECSGWGTELYMGNNVNKNVIAVHGTSGSTYSNIKIINCNVNGNQSNNTGIFANGVSGAYIALDLVDKNWEGILFEWVNDSEISSNYTHNNGGNGVMIKNGSRNKILNNTSNDNGFDGIYLTNDSNNNFIRGNFVSNNNDFGISLEGPNAYADTPTPTVGPKYNIVDNNTATLNGNLSLGYVNSWGQGIGCLSGTNKAIYNQITNNNVNNNIDYGIYILGCDSIVVSGNFTGKNSGSGLYAQAANYILISNNQVVTNSKDGISLSSVDESNISTNYIFESGKLTNNTYSGLKLDATSDLNLVNSNRIYGGSVAGNKQKYGINVIGTLNTFDANFIRTSITADIIDTGSGNYFSNYRESNTTGITLRDNVGIGTLNPSSLLEVGNRKFNVLSGGNVGIGSITPGQALDVQGTVRASQTFIATGITSDAALTDSTVCQDTTNHKFFSGSGTLGICLGTSTKTAKTNITKIPVGLSQIMKLRPILFNYKDGWGYDTKKDYYGFLAEDVEPILPILVGHDQKGEVKSADYVGMIPVIVQAIQEQQKQIDDLKKK